MHEYTKIYEFAASVGALEGYVYKKTSLDEMDTKALLVWTQNLVDAYGHFPTDVLGKIQPSLDLTLNRAISSFNMFLEKDHIVLERLHSMIDTQISSSPDDFQKKKWFQNDDE